MVTKKALGRGLDALLGDAGETTTAPAPRAEDALTTLPIHQLQRGKYQPRTKMDQASLEELAASIKAQGLIQPILVRPIAAERYESIASEVPVVIREVPDKATLAMALIENIQREDLNPLEEAQGFQRLAQEFQLTHQDLAESVGRSRTAVTNALRLLNLSAPVQQMLMDGKLDMGHARALLALEPKRQQELAAKIVEAGLSVREAEDLVNKTLNPPPLPAAKPAKITDRDVARLAEELSERLGTSVEIKSSRKGAGKLIISYTSNGHLGDLLERIK
jgi:ParB family transcriptional regulator, chromosome partitioning protein